MTPIASTPEPADKGAVFPPLGLELALGAAVSDADGTNDALAGEMSARWVQRLRDADPLPGYVSIPVAGHITQAEFDYYRESFARCFDGILRDAGNSDA